MKSSVATVIFLFSLCFSSCKKDDDVPADSFNDLPAGTFQITIYNTENQIVFTRQGEQAFFLGDEESAYVRLDDMEFVNNSDSFPNDAFASLSFSVKPAGNGMVLNENQFDADMSQVWYSISPDEWNYILTIGTLSLNWKNACEVTGLFKIKLTKRDVSFNPKWGENIIIIGRFNAEGHNHTCD